MQRLARMAEGYMAHFMAQHTFHFVVGHQVHQAAVDSNAAIGHGPGVDFLGQVNLVVDLDTVDVVAQ
ncbi:hypothetical protein D3C76_1731760 [compost metagenome]